MRRSTAFGAIRRGGLKAMLWSAALAVPLPALAGETFYFQPTSGVSPFDWNSAADPYFSWFDQTTGSHFIDVPTNGAVVNVLQSGTIGAANATILLNYAYTGTGLSSLTIDSNNTVVQSLATSAMIVAGTEYIGNSGIGAYTQSGGTHTAGTLYVGNFGTGAYSMTNGTLAVAADLELGAFGTGRFTQSGGVVTFGGYAYVGDFTAAAAGTFTQSGGATTIAQDAYVAYSGNGALNLSGGGTTTINGANGLFLAYDAPTRGTINVSAGTLNVANDLFVGYGGRGTYNQTAGATIVGGSGPHGLYLGYAAGSTGVATLAGGSLAVTNGTVYVGYHGTGTFTQTGGAHAVGGSLVVAALPGSAGTYNLQGGSLTAAAVALNTGGLFNQTAGNLSSGPFAQSGGLVTLSGGTFAASTTLVGNAGSGTFNQTGGKHLVTGDLVLANGLDFTVTMNTAPLSGPVYLDYQFVDGGLLNNNAVAISNVNFGGGAALGASTNAGGALGDLLANPAAGITLPDSAFLNEFTQRFAPGTSLSFRVHMTTSLDAGTSFSPDQLTFAILGGTSMAELPTTDPSGFNTFVTVTLDSNTPAVQAFGGSGGLAIAAPAIALLSSTGVTAAYSLSNSASVLTVGGSMYVGRSGPATFTQTGGSATVNAAGTGGLFIGYLAGTSGTVTLGGGTLTVAGTEYVGYNGRGILTQTAGTHAVGILSLGNQPGGSGTATLSGNASLLVANGFAIGEGGTANFTMSGGTATVSGDTWVARRNGSVGVFNQTGGTYNQSNGWLNIGRNEDNNGGGTAIGTYNLSGGVVNIGNGRFVVGGWQGGKGVLNMSGTATLTTSSDVRVGLGNGGQGTINLGGSAVLTAGNDTRIGGNDGGAGSTGVINQTGGTYNQPGNHLFYVGASGATGAYNLSGGTLNYSGRLYVGIDGGSQGTMVMSGGTVNGGAEFDIGVGGATGVLNQSAGTINILHTSGNAWNIVGQSGGNGTYNMTGGTATFADRSVIGTDAGSVGVLNVSNNAVYQTGDQLIIGSNTGKGAVGLSNSATLTVADRFFVGQQGSGTFTQTGGTTTVNATGTNGLFVGYDVGSGGTVTLGGGTLGVAGTEYVGFNGRGTLTQTGGTHTAGTLSLGDQLGGSGTATLSGGTLAATDHTYIGYLGTGAFVQTGGTHTAHWLQVGYAGTGSYSMTNGTLAVTADLEIGEINTGTFTQSGGTATVAGSAYVGDARTFAVGTFTQSGGAMTLAGNAYLGNIGSGALILSGSGTTTINGAAGLYLGYLAAATGTVNVSGGTLTVAAGDLVAGYGGRGNYNQTAGATLVGASGTRGLYLGYLAGSTGVATLTGGTLAVTGSEYVGYAGAGTFNQSGGSASVGGSLSVASLAGSRGAYAMSNGASLAVGASIFIGSQGSGSFAQTGGTAAINATGTNGLFVAYDVGSRGTATVSGGTLAVTANAYVGYNGTGTFMQSGGTATLLGTLTVGGSGTGVVTLAGGSFTAANTVNNGTINQTGGIASLGVLSGSNGTTTVGDAVLPGPAVMSLKSFDQRTFTINTHGTALLANNPARATNRAQFFNILGAGRLDLANNNLDIDGTSLPFATLRQWVVNGYHGGAWNGTGGITSTVAAANSSVYALAYTRGSDGVVPGLAASRYLVRPSLVGDMNLDGKADFGDILQLLGAGQYNSGQPAQWTDGDINYDGASDFGDILTLLGSGNYNSGQTFSSAARGLAPAKSTPKLTSGTPQTTTLATPGDGVPDFAYDPLTGDVTFRKDGVSVNGVNRVSALQVQSASGLLIVANSNLNGPTDVNSATSMSGANFSTAGYPDNFDLGRILPPLLTLAQFTTDLTFRYQIFGQGGTRAATAFVPEPSGLVLLGLGAAAAQSRRRRRRAVAP